MIETSQFMATEPKKKAAIWNLHWSTLLITFTLMLVLWWGLSVLNRNGVFDGTLAPDLRVSCRPALIGPGYVLQIVNAGNKPLFNVRVTSGESKRIYPVARQLGSGSSTEAGWMQLPGGIQLGQTYQIQADGYLLSRTVTMPEL